MKVREGHGWSLPITVLTFQEKLLMLAPVLVHFLWTKDFGFETWDLDLGLGLGLVKNTPKSNPSLWLSKTQVGFILLFHDDPRITSDDSWAHEWPKNGVKWPHTIMQCVSANWNCCENYMSPRQISNFSCMQQSNNNRINQTRDESIHICNFLSD